MIGASGRLGTCDRLVKSQMLLTHVSYGSEIGARWRSRTSYLPRYECGASPAMLTGHVRSRPGDLHTASPAYKAGALLSMLGGRCWCLPEELHLAPPLYQSGVPLPKLGGRSGLPRLNRTTAKALRRGNAASPSVGRCLAAIVGVEPTRIAFVARAPNSLGLWRIGGAVWTRTTIKRL